jgi:hypothetical protein
MGATRRFMTPIYHILHLFRSAGANHVSENSTAAGGRTDVAELPVPSKNRYAWGVRGFRG